MLHLLTYLKITKDFLKCKLCNRQELLYLQKIKFKKMLKFVYFNSEFYRKFYSDHGIKEKDLNDISIKDLPFTDKNIIEDNLDKVFTNNNLKKDEIGLWLEKNHNPADLYKNKYVIVHTSGSSGKIGIFVYDIKDWVYATSLAAMRIFSLTDFMTGKFVFFGATHGHFTGASIDAISLINTHNRLKLISILDPIHQVIKTINQFKPVKLIGYPSAICILARLSIKHKIDIHPTLIITSGEILTNAMIHKIKKAFLVEPCNFYITSETLILGARRSIRENLVLWDDLNLIETIEEEHHIDEIDNTGRVVVTNLFNKTTPLIRYKTDDRLVLTPKYDLHPQFSQFRQVKGICGRVLDPLPIITDTGKRAYIHPIVLVEFFVKDVDRFQFEASVPNIVTIYYESMRNSDEAVLNEFKLLLFQRKAMNGTQVFVKHIDSIEHDAGGKSKLIVIK